MSKPIDVKSLGLDAQAEIQAIFEAALAAEQPFEVTSAGGFTLEPWVTGEVAIPASTATQLPATAGANGFMLRVEADCLINSTNAASGGMILYDGDDIRLENVTDLNQVWITTIKNSATTLRWMTL